MDVCAYLRVSTVKQAERDLSIPDQQREIERHCKQQGYQLERVFIEAGASAMEDARPVFQEMIDWATSRDRPVRGVIVHSFSRFFRDAFLAEFYIRQLGKAGVALVSVTQDTKNDPTGELIRKIIALFDEYSSRENAKHVLRSMKENARRGYWNGSRPPFGYQTVEAARQGDKVKKVLDIDREEATVVLKIFDLYLNGEADRPSFGVKAIASYLNSRKISNRGRSWQIAMVHDILTRSTYAGTHHFNRTALRDRRAKPSAEWVEVKVPAIVSDNDFNRVQSLLKARNPKRMPPRTAAGPTLLTVIARCPRCGSAMILRTGKSGRYRYYTCSTQCRHGKSACTGSSVRMDWLDDQVKQLLAGHLRRPEWVKNALAGWLMTSEGQRDKAAGRLQMLKEQISAAEVALDRIYGAIEQGLLDASDDQLAHRIANHKTAKDEAKTLLQALVGDDGEEAIRPEQIERFGAVANDILLKGAHAKRKGLIDLLISQVIHNQGDLTLRGDPANLARAVAACRPAGTYMVPRFVQEWRAAPGDDENYFYAITL